jgi:alpha-N-arabinofuranosidase
VPEANGSVALQGARLVGELPAISWSVIRLARR